MANNDIGSVLQIEFQKAFAATATQAVKGTKPYFEAMFTALQNNVKSRKAFVSANASIAERMQRAMLASYDSRVTRQAKTEPYRIGQGRIGGAALRNALATEGFFSVTKDGIAFGNISALDSAAAFWYRLNFGAGARAETQYQSTPVPVSFGGRAFGSIALTTGPSRKPVLMPFGFWVSPEGRYVTPGSSRGAGDQFLPGGRTPNPANRPTAGIAGRHFFDAALVAFANRQSGFPAVYQDLVIQLADQADRTGRGALANVKVNVLP